jgi:hypothetical protein
VQGGWIRNEPRRYCLRTVYGRYGSPVGKDCVNLAMRPGELRKLYLGRFGLVKTDSIVYADSPKIDLLIDTAQAYNRCEVSMSAVTDYFERVQRNAHRRPRSMRALVAFGLVYLASGFVTALIGHDVSRAAWMLTLGLATVFCGVSESVLRGSQWRWLTRVLTMSMLFVPVWLSHHGIGYW